jgi:hypothetical protein
MTNRAWSDLERHAVLDSAPPHMMAAIALMMFTGLGPKDALRLPRTFCRDGGDCDATFENSRAGPLACPSAAR